MSGGDNTLGWALILLCLAVYFLPAIIAASRHHRQAVAIFLLTLFLGWTLVGWVAALVWAATAPSAPTPTVIHTAPPTPATPAEEIERYAGLKERGLITEEEYLAKKQQLLGQA